MSVIATESETAAATTNRSAVTAAWERAWRHEPSLEKDAAHLKRETRSPRFTLFVDRLEQTFGSIAGIKTIELGSGRGDLSALLARLGAHVTLLDTCHTVLDQARARFARLGLTADYILGDLLGNLGQLHGQYDVSLSAGVIEHFTGDDRTRAIAAHRAVLAPGGMTMISVPNALCPPYRVWKAYLEFRGWWPYGPEMPFAHGELRRRAHKVGFLLPETHGVTFWQSIGDQWIRRLLGRGPDWIDRPSRLDHLMGATLVMFGWQPGDKRQHARSSGDPWPRMET